jgi:putative transposase
LTGQHRIARRFARGRRDVVDLGCRDEISSATFYKRSSKLSGLEVSEAQQLWSREEENYRLKKQLAEAMFDNAVLKHLASKK